MYSNRVKNNFGNYLTAYKTSDLDVSGKSEFNGNVGIGKDNPVEKLDIFGGNIKLTGDNPNIIISNQLEEKSGIIFEDNSAPTSQTFQILFDAASQKLEISSDDLDGIMTFEPAGNVGVGITNPTQQFHTTSILLENNLFFVDTNTKLQGSGGDLIFYTSGSEAGRFKNTSQRFGIGTNNPNQLLHLHQSPGNTNTKIKFTNNETTNGIEFGLNGSDSKFQIKNRDNSDIDFYTNDTKRMCLCANGEVDFNSPNPIILPRLTTTERDGISGSNGMIIYNTTLNKFQGYENGAWVSLI